MNAAKELKFSQPALAVSIQEAAHMVGISERRFYEDYIYAGRVFPVAVGTRRLIVVDELRDAFRQYAEQNRVPLDVKPS